MDDDSSDESPRTPKRTQKRAPSPTPLKEEFPALGGAWSRRSVAPEVAKTSFVEMAVKPKEIALAEKQTRDEERLGKAIATGMVIIERGSQGVVMTHPPKTAKQLEKEKHHMDCFKRRNGKGWADVESDDDDEEEEMVTDAW